MLHLDWIFLKKVVDMFWWFAELLYLCTRKRETRAPAGVSGESRRHEEK